MPQMLEAVEIAGAGFENMHNNIAHIQKSPVSASVFLAVVIVLHIDGKDARTAGGIQPLPELDLDADFVQAVVDSVGNGLDMTGTCSGTDHKIVAVIDYLAHVHDDDILGFLVKSGTGGCLSKL